MKYLVGYYDLVENEQCAVMVGSVDELIKTLEDIKIQSGVGAYLRGSGGLAMEKVTNQYGVDIDTEVMAAFAYDADEDLAIQITNMPCDNDQQWFDVFCWAYVLKHNEPFFLDDPNPVF